ncbi:TATA-binding protein-associated factor 2N [Daphnia magna]|uniref:Uncharacterized protein n=2 Tax=Daphnia magna TaxID=35525 RepID=A0A164LF84_9CRUS|nr:TATA-binding protein-associated factor 2N [Daphnia magna]KAK4008510.1 hypothetical protein OUZ56_013646 [Daphnia magna]KZS04055.1 Uncharacterized protein APZ42_033129 [Daphnia magna]
MFSLRVIVGLLLVVWSTASSVVFEESPSTSNDNTNVGTRNGPFDDSVVIEAAGSPSGGDVDSRFFGLLGGGNRPFGGGGFGGGHPIGATKPGRCPGLLGLGLGQPEGGYGGFGGYGGYPGGYGGYPGGYGGYPGGYGGYGNHHPHHGAGGYGYPGQYGYGGGYNGGFGFRSADQGGESGDKTERRKRSDEANKETSGGDASVQGRSGGETDPRFLGAIGGLLGQPCYQDYQCPGQLKCCAKALGNQASCQQPALLG